MEPQPGRPRVNRILLARFEQWALPQMAGRLPHWVVPDHLTVLGLFAALLIGAAYALTHLGLGWLWLASAGFVLHWWADSLDGTLARVRHIERERYGFFVDHQADAVAACLILGGLGISPLMPFGVAMLILIGYLLMMVHVSIVALTRGTYKISFGRFGPTEARLAMILVNTIVILTGNPSIDLLGTETSIFGAIGGAGAAVLGLIYVGSVLVERAQLARLDPPPAPRPVVADFDSELNTASDRSEPDRESAAEDRRPDDIVTDHGPVHPEDQR